MSTLNRRDFIRITGLGTVTAATGLPSLGNKAEAAVTQHIIVIGGGFGGATAAKHLVEWAAADGVSIEVTLIDRNSTYPSPVLSNLVLVGALSKAKLDFPYSSLTGVNFVQGEVTGIDASNRVVTAGGKTYTYDRLIVAPGIDFLDTNGAGVPITGLQVAINKRTIIPAWKGGSDVVALRNQLTKMPATNPVFILSIPKAPYRCPPGPYERACVVADWLKKNRTNGKVIVLDANPDIMAEKHTFSTAFAAMGVTYIPNAHLSSVSLKKGLWTVIASTGTYNGHVLNVLPRQRAGKVLDLIPDILDVNTKFAPVHALTYESRTVPFVHVIGDAHSTAALDPAKGQPKAGHIANGEAKACADAIIKMVKLATDAKPRLTTSDYIDAVGVNTLPTVVTNSACFSPIKASSAKTASYLTVGYRADSVNDWKIERIESSLGEAPSPSGENWEDMFDWAENLFYDTFNITRNMG